MIRTLSKKRSSKDLLSIHMKFLLIVACGFLFYTSNNARTVAADSLITIAEYIQPVSDSSISGTLILVLWCPSPIINT